MVYPLVVQEFAMANGLFIDYLILFTCHNGIFPGRKL